MRQFNKKLYFTFFDLLNYDGNQSLYFFNGYDLADLCAEAFGWDTAVSGDSMFANYPNVFEKISSNTIWSNRSDIIDILGKIYNRHANNYIFSLDEDCTGDDIVSCMCQFLVRFIDTMEFCGGKYMKLIKIYKDEESNLMSQLSATTTSVSKFNDTPQIPAGSGAVLEDDPYVTNINQAEVHSSSDPNTIMARINEIQSSYRNIELMWIREIDKLFLMEDNL